jgi:hypothetical protein
VEKEQNLQYLMNKNTGFRYLPNEESPLLAIIGEILRKTSFEKGFPY